MGAYYSHLGANYQLPEQSVYCAREGAECGYLQQKAGRSWEKRLAVLTPEGSLVLYKFFLIGVCPAVPLIGRVYNLKECERMDVTTKGKSLLVNIVTCDDKKLCLKFKGSDSKLCAGALARSCIQTDMHKIGTTRDSPILPLQ